MQAGLDLFGVASVVEFQDAYCQSVIPLSADRPDRRTVIIQSLLQASSQGPAVGLRTAYGRS